jgi:indolepyruvate ferredoxin oxidoreductase
MGRNFEFDFSPKKWMLKGLRHLRWLRAFNILNHQKEQEVSRKIRTQLLEIVPQLPAAEFRKKLVLINNVKGYRSIRIRNAKKYFGEA